MEDVGHLAMNLVGLEFRILTSSCMKPSFRRSICPEGRTTIVVCYRRSTYPWMPFNNDGIRQELDLTPVKNPMTMVVQMTTVIVSSFSLLARDRLPTSDSRCQLIKLTQPAEVETGRDFQL